jgi:hypothetical protein
LKREWKRFGAGFFEVVDCGIWVQFRGRRILCGVLEFSGVRARLRQNRVQDAKRAKKCVFWNGRHRVLWKDFGGTAVLDDYKKAWIKYWDGISDQEVREVRRAIRIEAGQAWVCEPVLGVQHGRGEFGEGKRTLKCGRASERERGERGAAEGDAGFVVSEGQLV